ncbi:MAG: hypothetical protein KGJ78_04245 [Alphaproteobacteria bacterium]|nr:hypothetical protein [Alphaproteobacteria bacterium]
MHPFFIIGAVYHMLAVAVLAFFVLFAASRADGFVKILGNVLGWLLLIAALLVLVCGVIGGPYAHPFGAMGWGVHTDAPSIAGPPPAAK